MRPFTASYIALCKEVRLERAFEDHDSVWVDTAKVISLVEVFDYIRGYHRQERANQEWVWLPRLDQLLDLLEEEGNVVEIAFRLTGKGYEALIRAWSPVRLTEDSVADGSSREEVALRLLLSVRRRVPA